MVVQINLIASTSTEFVHSVSLNRHPLTRRRLRLIKPNVSQDQPVDDWSSEDDHLPDIPDTPPTLPEGWFFKSLRAPEGAVPLAPVNFTPVAASHSTPNRQETEYWFQQFRSRIDDFVNMLLVYVLPTIQRSMCRIHAELILWRLQSAVCFVHDSTRTLCRVTEYIWWQHTHSFQNVPRPDSPIECRPWHTAYQQFSVRKICRERLFHLVEVARDLQAQIRSCLCCARHARKFCVGLIACTKYWKNQLSTSIRRSCKLY